MRLATSIAALLVVLASCKPDEGCPDPGCDSDTVDDTDPGLDPELVPTTDPGMPDFPATVGTVTLGVRTGSGTFDGSDTNTVVVCLTATDCFPLATPDVDEFRVGDLDVYAFEGLSLPRASIDRVEIRSADGSDLWRADCLEVRLDGEPVYCHDDLGLGFGDQPDELQSWSDPDGLHNGCVTCQSGPLTHGPMLGVMEPDRARVWVRTDATRPVALRMSSEPDLDAAPVVAWAYPSPADDFTAVLEVSGLQAAKTYYYAVEVDGERLAEGQTLTTSPPVGQSGAFDVAFGSCSKQDLQPIFGIIDQKQPDLFFFVGDNHYGNTSNLDALRHNYRWSLERPFRGALLTHTPTWATWDDHDFVGNNTSGDEPGKPVALRAFREYWANPSYGTPALEGVFFRHSYGDVDFFFLDGRYWRGFDDSLLGDAQTAWLVQGLTASTATFKVLALGSQWTKDGSSDSWGAFPAKRAALFEALHDADVQGLVLLSGDVHRSELRLLALEGGAHPYRVPELTSSPLDNLTSPCPTESEILSCYDDGPSFELLSFDTTASDPTLTVTLFDEFGREQATWTLLRSELQPASR